MPFTPLSARPQKVATPDEKVPEVPPAAIEPPPEIVAEAVPELTEVTTLPLESSTLTTGCWARAAPLFSVAEGSVVMTSWVAVPALMVKLVEVPEVRPVLVAERV